MMSPSGDRREPDARQVAAFLDGELDGAPQAELRRWIQAWLRDHPEARAAALAQRQLKRLLHATQPEEPSEAAWDSILAKLTHLPAPAARTMCARKPVQPLGLPAAILAIAAGVLAAVALWQPLPPPEVPTDGEVAKQAPIQPPLKDADGGEPKPIAVAKQSPAPRPPEVEPFSVASADEIEIIRIVGADMKTVIVGNMPVNGPLLLAAPGEIVLTRADPEVRMGEAAPYLWVHEEDDQ